MASSIVIIHHLGLGDQIMLNGMVRHFVEIYQKVYIFVKNCHLESVQFMYRDLHPDKLELLVVDNTNPSGIWETVSTIQDCRVLPLATYDVSDVEWAFFTQEYGNRFSNWAHGVYIQARINPLYMYSKFKCVRDPEREDQLFNKFPELELNNYIFIHDDHFRDRKISNTRKDLKIFKPGSFPTDTRQEFFSCDNSNIFDYLKIIECAKEVHCMNSSYNWMIDLLKIGDPTKNFFHLDTAHPYYKPDTVKTVFSDQVWTFI